MIKYSEILSEFIKPWLVPNETEESFLTKAQTAVVIWNYCVMHENNLAGKDQAEKDLRKAIAGKMMEKLSVLAMIDRKQTHFAQYSNLIATVKINTKPGGLKTLYVESAPASAFPNLS